MDHKNIVFKPEGRVIKAVRANLMIPYIHRKFPSLKIVYIWRDPVQVIMSRTAKGWEDHLDTLVNQLQKLEKYYPAALIRKYSSGTEIQRQTAFWCLENKMPIAYIRKNNLLLISYQDLITHPTEELKRLNEYTGLGITESKFLRQLAVPSQSSKKPSSKFKPSDSALNEIRAVLADFEMLEFLS
jgi:hypothetical protein